MENFYDFIRQNPSVKRLKINDVLFAEYRCPLSETRFDIWSQHNYFIYVISGKKKWFTSDHEFLVQQGDCLFVRKGAHSVIQYFDDKFCALVMFFPDSFIRSVLLENRIKLNEPEEKSGWNSLTSIKPNELLSTYFHSFLTYLSASSLPDKKLIELKFRELIILVATGVGDKNLSGYFADLCRTDKSSLREVMEANFAYPMKLEEYARLSNRSLSAFKRDFKSIYNITPGKWLIQKRLEFAKYLIEHTGKSVTEICLDSGFKDVSHFSYAFRRTFKTTPRQYSKRAVNK
jgi:AraC family transcriptional regulator, exoenzyme S synthesis regulatory protein ExsA